jgi:hypothetical protein
MPETFFDVRCHPDGALSLKHVDGGPWMYFGSERAATYWLTKASKDALERLNQLVAEHRK